MGTGKDQTATRKRADKAEDAWRLSEVVSLEGTSKQALVGGLLEFPKATHSENSVSYRSIPFANRRSQFPQFSMPGRAE